MSARGLYSSAAYERDVASHRPPHVPVRADRGDWVKTEHAYELLGSSYRGGQFLRGLPRRKAEAPPGVGGRRAWMYRRRDIERARLIMDVTGLPLRWAVKVVAAEARGRL